MAAAAAAANGLVMLSMSSVVGAKHPGANLSAASGELIGEAGLRCRLRLLHAGKQLGQPGRRGLRGVRAYIDPVTADREKEEARLYRRTVYDHEQWLRHRSSTRHARHILSITSSRVILSLGPPVYALTLFSATIVAFNYIVINHLIDLPEWVGVLHISALPFQLTAPALALLLVFRTNSSYGRFDEARKLWGSNVNRTRDVARQGLSWIRAPQDSEKLAAFLRYVAAYPYCLKDHLTREDELVQDLTPILKPEELEKTLASSHRPNHMVQMMSNTIAQCQLSDINKTAMDRNFTQFHDNTGACERIFKTPIPVSYTRLTSRFLILWHLVLPLCLWDSCKWLVIPATMTSAGALLCIDEVGVLIEEPFSILPLAAICGGINSSIKALVASHSDWQSLRSITDQKTGNGAAGKLPESRPDSSSAVNSEDSYYAKELAVSTSD